MATTYDLYTPNDYNKNDMNLYFDGSYNTLEEAAETVEEFGFFNADVWHGDDLYTWTGSEFELVEGSEL